MLAERTVVIVDDDRAAAASVAALIMSLGMKSRIHHSAESFLESCGESPADCLVLDLRLSGMSGLELQETLAAQSMEIPTIVVSGHADGDISGKVLANGAIAVLEKPYDGARLCAAIRTALDRSG